MYTGDCGGIGRIWDMRSGQSVLVLQGHVKTVLSADFSPNGYHLATGGSDHTCRIWDLRRARMTLKHGDSCQNQALYTIPAHSQLVSKVRTRGVWRA